MRGKNSILYNFTLVTKCIWQIFIVFFALCDLSMALPQKNIEQDLLQNVAVNMKAKALFLDRDGIVIKSDIRNGKPYAITSINAMQLNPEIKEIINKFKADGYKIVIVTNQPDVGNGLVKKEVIEAMHARLLNELSIDLIEVCYHKQAERCECRKPNTGMFLAAAKKLDINLQESIMIGDRISDIEAGKKAGCKFTIFVDYKYKETPDILEKHPWLKADMIVDSIRALPQALSSEQDLNFQPYKVQKFITSELTSLNKSNPKDVEQALPVYIGKNTMVFFCGLAGVGKRTYIDALRKRLVNSVKFEKDVLSDGILNGLDHNTDAYKTIKDRIYRTLTLLAINNMHNNHTIAIMQAYYGDKLTTPGILEYITSKDYEVKIIYLHCSGKKQLERLLARNLSRDKDKVPAIAIKSGQQVTKNYFENYRQTHIQNHLLQLAQVEHLIVDTEDDASFAHNVQKILEYLQTPSLDKPIKLIPVNKDDCQLTIEQAMTRADKFRTYIDELRLSKNEDSSPG